MPPEKLELVRVAISSGSTKGEILSVIEDLAEKVETAEKQVVELQAEKEAADHLVEAKNKTIDKLQREVKRFEKLPPDEKLEALLKDCTDAMNDARGSVLGRMRLAFVAVANAGDDRHAHDMFLAGLVGQLQAELNELRDEFNLVVVGGEPEWERWAKAQELAKTGKQAKAN
ncbi:MAG: hypothetical protein A2W72_01505 [Burkholderiales bacterium RIFCSPLOWO2_12_67_14]|nr:MAG: hypothetical protein A3I64_07180 [Burkholderiales bacterium RIFCSPLOWO2_02_FULL_67_64]OGB40019.1 MAG: hypothetical protein A3E51_05465 [Burkholderiales bacterium RIFCSPHIGHO2_12_FULL_67_38]OGB46809.1 MAG: hypothetical protein A2W72_01505 [Burkholderiales bacterium RIFCSPLOWO2_12_67_14]OGB81093.1 MAG: hypothetical protein A3G82_14055 [Burkholderiales bacterium RIFCSPLOWO2_12_FULL_67_210]